jgi:hypothetical protein
VADGGLRPEDLFAGSVTGLAVLAAVRDLLADCEIRTSKSQVAFRLRRGFAYLWRPGQYLARPGAEVVLSIVLDRADPSPRFKEVAHPARSRWIHHLEVQDPAEIDVQVAGWLREAASLAE